MTNANDFSPARGESSSEAGTDTSDPQSLTDLIDELDRAAFRRALANRDPSNRDYQTATARERAKS